MAVAINTQRAVSRTDLAGISGDSGTCMWCEFSRNQESAERERYGDRRGIANFIEAGCLSCDGRNMDCKSYSALSTLGL